MADRRPILVPNSEQLELLTRLRLDRTSRARARREMIREAVILLPCITYGRRKRECSLVCNMLRLRTEEAALRAMKMTIWRLVR
ncbi:unnamed protein product [Penicillium glandicola]